MRGLDQVQFYLESHITIDPVFDKERERASHIAARYRFKLAHLIMVKGEPSKRDTFMTGHSNSRTDIEKRTKWLVRALQDEGFNVRRYKIEDTLLDSRIKDEWKLL